MFETSVVQARVQAAARRPLLLSISIGAHAAAIAGVIAASVATVKVPVSAPRQFALLTMPVIPPMKGDGGQSHPKPAVTPPQTERRAPATPATVVAPTTVPSTVTPAAATDTGKSTDILGTPTPGDGTPGVPWGKSEGIGTDGPPATVVAPPKVYTMAEGIKAPVPLRRVTPPYPEIARRMRLNGYAVVECIIDQSGRVRDARVLTSSNSAFEQPAIEAVRQWQFSPGTLNGQPVDVQFDLTVKFQLN
ncbi:MAG TPA: TonB family protein [Thermoanaerobaculia bacterium]|nr:TonB family protein [Thermoanaerobaculia bacterium]